MKKQDKESLIQEIQKRLDWYTMEASDEEFDADEVQSLLKLLDSLTPEEEKDRLSSDEVVDNFWKYCAEREEEERSLAEVDAPEKKKEHKVLHYFQKHRAVAVAAAVLMIVIMLGGSWQMAVNAEKHGGFFWWMDKNEVGTTMITSPEMVGENPQKSVQKVYNRIEDVPDIYREYVNVPYEIMCSFNDGYSMSRIETIETDESDTINEFFSKEKNPILHFKIKIYPQEILRVRETYPGYVFCEEFENEGIDLEVFRKQEDNGNLSYIIYFYYGNEKYAVAGINDKEFLKEIAVKYQEAVVNNY